MIQAIILAVIGSGVLSAIISGIFTIVAKKKAHNEGVSAGTRILLYDRIKQKGRQYIIDGNIAAEDLEDIIEMHRIYHDELCGNGYLDTLMRNVRQLPIKQK